MYDSKRLVRPLISTLGPLAILLLVGMPMTGCSSQSENMEVGSDDPRTKSVTPTDEPSGPRTGSEPELANLEVAYFASGCFWCVEAIFESVKGVEEAVSGYAGGTEDDPSYEAVSRGATSHAEAVAVYYDPKVIDYRTLLHVYYASHDPTTIDGQAPDFGRQYRSMILAGSDDELQLATEARDSVAAGGAWSDPIATELVKLDTFWAAELYHQDFERRNPNQGYIRAVSIPRLNRFKSAVSSALLKGGRQEPH